MAKKPKPDDPVESYARDVTAGRVVVGRLVFMACARHLRDLAKGGERGLSFDQDAAQKAIGFFAFLCLTEGADDGEPKPFLLQPWQAFIVGSLFGWKGEDGYRRFRTAYVEGGKGCGKSPLAAGIALYGLVADGERGAEIYSAATTREQASILFRDAKNMIEASPELSDMLVVGIGNVAHAESQSFFRPCSSEHRGLDGKRVHVALIDELHEHPTSLVADKMRAGTKGRRQALIFEITNAGYDRESVCYQHHEYSRKVLEAASPGEANHNDSWFAYVCTLDSCAAHHAEGKQQPVDGCPDCDDWRDESTWLKANPNLGVSITRKYLAEQVEEAKGMPAKEGIVKRLNFCLWCEAETQWLSAELWSRGGGKLDPAALAGRECYGGLDLASKVDVAAFVLAFPDFPGPGDVSLLPFFWIPEETAKARSVAENVPWPVWAREGHVTLTEGEVIDQDAIEAEVKRLCETYRVVLAKVDPWNAAQITVHLMQYGLEVEEFRQNAQNFNEPTKLFEAMLKEGRLKHGDHPVLSWMAGNVSVLSNVNENVRPVKPKHGSPKRVDGIVAAVMALSGVMVAANEGAPTVEVW